MNSTTYIDVETEFADIDKQKAWTRFYQEIKNDSSKNDFTTVAATENKNKILNRYRDVNPYDHSRIVLSQGNCDYINANFIKIEKANRHYILTQGPLSHTIGHFWLMVWEQGCRAIVMLNKLVEKNQEKCHRYWPLRQGKEENSTLLLNDVGLKVELTSQKEFSCFTVRSLRLYDLKSGAEREVMQFQYTEWPDFGVPRSTSAFLRFLGVVRSSGVLSDMSAPLIVHCSAGIGRSGTFILVDSSLVLMKEFGTGSVKVKDVLIEMRRSRMGLVHTPDQLRFSYLAIIEGLKKAHWDSNNLEDECEGSGDDSSSAVESVHTSDDVSDSDSDDPPPPPPPRSESLSSQSPSPPPRPPAPLPQTNNTTSKSESSFERKHAEQQERVAKKVVEMKRKQDECEAWARTKRSLVYPLSLGAVALAAAVIVAMSYKA